MTEAIAHVIKSVPNDQVLEKMELVALPLALRLHEIGQAGLPSGKDEQIIVIKEIEELLDQLSVFLQHVVPRLESGQAHPLVPFLTKMWPLLASLMSVFGGEARVCESVSRVLRYAMDNTRTHLLPLLPEIVNAMVSAYQQHGSSSFLWMAKKIVRGMGVSFSNYLVYANEETGSTLAAVVEQMGVTTFQIFSRATRLDDIPDGILC
jgi:transportin-3